MTRRTGGWCWTCCWSAISEAGTTLVLVTHDPEIASRADRKIVLKDGMVVEDTLPSGSTRSRRLRKSRQMPMAKSRIELEACRGDWLARSEVRAGKFGFVVLSVAVGVAALVGVRGFSESFRRTLDAEARSLDGAAI